MYRLKVFYDSPLPKNKSEIIVLSDNLEEKNPIDVMTKLEFILHGSRNDTPLVWWKSTWISSSFVPSRDIGLENYFPQSKLHTPVIQILLSIISIGTRTIIRVTHSLLLSNYTWLHMYISYLWKTGQRGQNWLEHFDFIIFSPCIEAHLPFFFSGP